MPKGLYLSIGLNSVDPVLYEGWSGMLAPCENDAKDIAAIATVRGFKGVTLLTQDATSVRVLREIQDAARQLKSGDIFIIYYSGHGSNVGDTLGDEDDSLDETWCLFDRMLIDDELYALWSLFSFGVRILVISDSCNSGTVTKKKEYDSLINSLTLSDLIPKCIPLDKAWPIYIKNRTWYDGIKLISSGFKNIEIKPSIMLISGCQDNQLSLAGNPNSFFTKALIDTWNSGSFDKGYRNFHNSILKLMPPTQSPNFYVIGAPNIEFESQIPFTI